MAVLVVRIGVCRVRSKAEADISSKNLTVYVFIVFDCCESLENDSLQAVQELSESAAWERKMKLLKRYADMFHARTSRSWEKRNLNEHICHVNDIHKQEHQLKQALILHKKYWQEWRDKFGRDFEANMIRSSIADRYKGNIVSLLKRLDQEITERNDCHTVLFRLKNEWSETAYQSDLEQCLRQLIPLQNHRLGTFGANSSHWCGTILYNNGIDRKTDTVKVCVCDRLRRLILPNHVSKLFVLHPKLRTIDGNRQLSVMLVA